MLNVGALREGYVLDHIKAGKAMTIYHDLKLDKLDCTVAIIKNARSNKMGKKDIIKVEKRSSEKQSEAKRDSYSKATKQPKPTTNTRCRG